MLHSRSLISCATLVLLTAALTDLRETHGDDKPEKYMHVKLILSDSEVFTNDGLAYKVVIKNISRSLVTICGPTIKPKFACIIEGKAPEGDWREIWDYPRGIKHTVRAPINIPAGSTWAEYGQVFLSKGKAAVFDKAGKWELRGRIKTVIGEYTSDPVELTVKPWPKGDEPVDKRFQPFGQVMLNEIFPLFEEHLGDLKDLCKRHSSGGVAKSLKLLLDVETYEQAGMIAGKAATWSDAFKSLSPGLDEVRHDQLVFLLGYGATKSKQWKDVAELVKEIKDESDRRIDLQGELDGAIVTGEYREP